MGRENLLQRSRSRGEAVLHQLGELGVHWQFWRKWYDGFLQGTPIDWDLQRRVARIPDDEWERGIEHVSKYIDDLEKGTERPERLPETPVRAQAQKLIQAALVFETSARGLQNLIHMAVDAYRREVSNALPEELQPLEQLPPTLEQIALILAGTPTSPGSEAELYHLLQSMAATISALNLRLKQSNLKVSDLENRLSDRSGRRLFASAFYTKSGEGMAGLMTSKILWGGVISGVGFVLGPSGDALLEALDHCYKEIIIPETPAYDLSRLPPSTEV